MESFFGWDRYEDAFSIRQHNFFLDTLKIRQKITAKITPTMEEYLKFQYYYCVRPECQSRSLRISKGMARSQPRFVFYGAIILNLQSREQLNQ